MNPIANLYDSRRYNRPILLELGHTFEEGKRNVTTFFEDSFAKKPTIESSHASAVCPKVISLGGRAGESLGLRELPVPLMLSHSLSPVASPPPVQAVRSMHLHI